jgi:hypothetical protein
MGLPVTVYRWDDVGAPQLSSNPKPSEFIAVLKACLVDGYGTKQPLGWLLRFEDTETYKIVFSNDTTLGASGGSVQYWSENGTDVAGKMLRIKTASSITAIDSFIQPSYLSTHTHNINVNQWVIIGTSAGFYVFPHVSINDLNYVSTAYVEGIYFIGDIDSYFPNDMGRFSLCIGTSGADRTYVNFTHSLGYSASVTHCKLYGVDGNDTAFDYRSDAGTFETAANGSNATFESQGLTPAFLPVMLMCTTSTGLDPSGVRTLYSNANPLFRGVIPGLYVAQMSGYGNVSWPYEMTIDGVRYQLLRGYHNQIWLNIDEWY